VKAPGWRCGSGSERAKILKSFLARPQIYSTQFFRDKYEAQARFNLVRSIAQLEGARA
jgi:predicted metal-dependent HD superfamily phosphohydrolase